MDWLDGLGWAGVISVGISFLWDLFLPLNLLVIGVIYVTTLLAGFFSQETKPVSEVKPAFTTEKCKPPNLHHTVPTTPHHGARGKTEAMPKWQPMTLDPQ